MPRFSSSDLISSHFSFPSLSVRQLLPHEQAVGVLVVKLDDAGQLVRLHGKVERVGVLNLVADSILCVSILKVVEGCTV
jgi:hypothetical protein